MNGNLELLLRVGFSFSIVLGLLWICARVLRNRTGGRPTDTVEVLARTQLGRGANVTVLRVADRAIVLGVTERGIVQLGESITDLAALTPQPRAAEQLQPALPTPDISAVEVNPAIDLLPAQRSRRSRAASSTTVPSAPQAMAGQGALAGSILSPATWRLGMDALRERTVRRG
ncbi:MAG: flagellar biosynthetic protein FliO [Sporichthyaceae bacterium]